MLLSFDSTVLRLFFLCSSLIKPLSASDQRPLISHSESDQVLPRSASRWNFNFSSSAPHYFASVYGLLQQSSNTFFPNGHSIAPCEIPPFTKLYHGRRDGELPPSPEWISFDIEMAYGIMGSTRNSHMLTYQTTRPMKCIYFDGESATLMGTGQMDTQMLQLYGNVSGPVQDGRGFRGLYDEYARATGLCDWLRDKKLGGPGWGYEGIVRMNAGFEMIVCNFSSPSLRLVSHLNITAPLLAEDDDGDKDKFVQDVRDVDLSRRADMTSYFPLPPSQTNTDRVTNPTDPPGPPNWRRGTGGEPFLRSQAWGWFTSASTHYGSSALGAGLGEIRVKPLSCGVLNYYSPIFTTQAIARAESEQKSLNLTTSGVWTGPGSNGTRAEGLIHLTRRRRAHTLDAVTTIEASIMKANSERVLRDLLSSSPNCSGIDWAVMTNEIVQRNAGDLAEFLMVLQKYNQIPAMVIKNQTAVREWMVEVRELTHSFLLPFLEYPASRGEEVTSDTWTRGSRLFNDTHARCQFHHTRLLDPQEGLLLSPEENTLKWAVEETHGGICDVLVDVGLSVEGMWESKFSGPVKDSEVVENKGMKTEIERWIEGVEELMAWLGWAGEWVGCEKRCAYDEKCFIPMWPMLARRNPGFGRGPPPGEGGDRPGRHGPDFGDKPGEGRPSEGRPGEDGPGNGRPGKGGPGGPGGPGRGRPGRGGGPGWNQDDTELWKPTCVKIDHIMG